MPERPPEFTDIDLDEEDDDEHKPAPVDEEVPADPIDFDDEDEDDVDEDDEEEKDANGDGEFGGGAPAASSPAPAYGEEDEEEAGEAGDGVARAAAVLKYIVEHIVDEPDQISIGATMDDRGPVLLLRVADDDRGKIIGRQGRIVQAIRTVVKAATVGTGEKVSVEVID